MAHDSGEDLLREQLEQLLLGQLSPTLRAIHEARIAAEPEVSALWEEVRAGAAALRAALEAEQTASATSEEDDVLIADFLDGALQGDALAALEARLTTDAALLARLVQCFRDVQATADPDGGPALVEKFLAGHKIDFVKREPAATGEIPSTYAELAEAVEERKRRYLQFGN